MKILFIGGTGVISHSCSQLCLEKGYDLFLLTRGKSFRYIPAGAKIINGDINDVQSIKGLISAHKFDAVVDWIAFTQNNVERDFELFRDKTEQYVFISSASVYSPKRNIPITEETIIENPYWAYSRAKIDCENYLTERFEKENFPVTIVRPSHTYDKTKNPLRADYLPFHRMKNGKPIMIHDEGKSLWTLTHTKDFAKGFVGLLGNKKSIGEKYHITSDEVLTWNKIAEILTSKAGYELNIVHIPSEFIAKYDEEWGAGLLGDKANNAVFDNSKIKNIVPDFTTAIPFEKGAEEIVEWYSNPQNQIFDFKLDALMDKIILDYKQR